MSAFHVGGDLWIWPPQAFDAISDYRKVLRKKKKLKRNLKNNFEYMLKLVFPV